MLCPKIKLQNNAGFNEGKKKKKSLIFLLESILGWFQIHYSYSNLKRFGDGMIPIAKEANVTRVGHLCHTFKYF